MKNKSLNTSTTKWLQVTLPVNDAIEGSLINYLFELGCCGCQQLEKTVVAYFSGQIQQQAIHQKIKDYLSDLSCLGFIVPDEKIDFHLVENQDWNRIWKQQFQPIKITKRIVVKPSWVELPPSVNALIIDIDPKQAFGTGSHATTRMTIQLLEKYLSQNHVVLDVGTGTGILAIAAVKLGAGKVVALDKDRVAAETAKENLQQNATDFNTLLFMGELNALSPSNLSFDLIMANLNKTEIFKLRHGLERILKNSGYLIISGILQEEHSEVQEQFSKSSGLKIIEVVNKEDWMGFVLKKEPLN